MKNVNQEQAIWEALTSPVNALSNSLIWSFEVWELFVLGAFLAVLAVMLYQGARLVVNFSIVVVAAVFLCAVVTVLYVVLGIVFWNAKKAQDLLLPVADKFAAGVKKFRQSLFPKKD